MKPDLSLSDLGSYFPEDFSPAERARAQTLFLEELSLRAHAFYRGKMTTMPKAGLFGFNWFNVYYTPGVAAVSTAIRDNNDLSFDLTNRDNLVAIVSDSSRVLGEGDVTPSGGLGVMEGKAFLMKYLAGVDGVSLCISSADAKGRHDPDRIIEFVKMVQPSFGAVNLEDISQPNCFRVLDQLREESDIPVWHDDAQGTAAVTLAGLLGALRVAGKELGSAKIVLLGAGAANTTAARLLLVDGADPERMVVFDSRGALHAGRTDLEKDPAFYRKWELARVTNPSRVEGEGRAFQQADVVIAASRPGPEVIRPEWVRSMRSGAIVFACANPVPEIYPYAAKEAGALVVATGRGDFPNQVNNSMGFPGILKGALLSRARKITDGMAIAAAHSIAAYAEERLGLDHDRIMPSMEDTDLFPQVAEDVARQAAREGVARRHLAKGEALRETAEAISSARAVLELLMSHHLIASPDPRMLEQALEAAVSAVLEGRARRE